MNKLIFALLITALAMLPESVSAQNVEFYGVDKETSKAELKQKVATLKTKFQNAGKKKPNILIIWGDDIGTWN